jgi:hypothetical protein
LDPRNQFGIPFSGRGPELQNRDEEVSLSLWILLLGRSATKLPKKFKRALVEIMILSGGKSCRILFIFDVSDEGARD